MNDSITIPNDYLTTVNVLDFIAAMDIGQAYTIKISPRKFMEVVTEFNARGRDLQSEWLVPFAPCAVSIEDRRHDKPGWCTVTRTDIHRVNAQGDI